MFGFGFDFSPRGIGVSFFSKIIALFKKRVEDDGGTFEAGGCLRGTLNDIGKDAFEDATIILTPNGYGEGVIYDVKDNADCDVVRASGDTRIDENGQIVSIGNNVPNISYPYGGASEGCPFIKVQEEATNLVDQSYPDTPPNPCPVDVANNFGSAFFGNAVAIDKTVSGLDNTKTYFVRAWLYLVAGYNYTAWQIRNVGNAGQTINADLNIQDEWQLIEGYMDSTTSIAFRTAGSGSKRERYLSLLHVVDSANYDENSSYIPTSGAIATRLEQENPLTPPVGTTQITEYFTDGSTNVITSIPATYEMSKGDIEKVIFE